MPHDALVRTGLAPARTVLLFQMATLYLCLVALALVLLVEVTFLLKFIILALALALGFALFFCLARIWAEPPGTGEARVDMLGVPLARIDMEGALARIDQFVEERSPRLVVTSDTLSIVRARDDPEFQAIVRGADMVTADGRGVVWMARVLGLPVAERVSGVDMMERICERAGEKGYSVYLLGARPGVAEEAARALRSRCPGLRVVGTHHGYFTAAEEPAVIEAIVAVAPDILLVALGSPSGGIRTNSGCRSPSAWVAASTCARDASPARRSGCSGPAWSGCFACCVSPSGHPGCGQCRAWYG
jgi:UDP-N-acetyl-D-mannosaminuronic acid transferase (WecB/TagA/CpsF family)